VRARRLDTGEYLLSPRASRIVVAVIESDLRHPEPGERLHPWVAGRFRACQALQEESLRGRTLAPTQRGAPKQEQGIGHLDAVLQPPPDGERCM